MARDQTYREAEKKIEEARRTGATELALVGMGLTELPESLCELTHLQKLHLNGNQLTASLESLGQLTQLQKLDLRRNQLSGLPESLGQLTQLETLDLSYNQLTSLPFEFSGLSKLRVLNLGRNEFGEIPEPIRAMKRLETLQVFDLKLNHLPDWLGELTYLEMLNAQSNDLDELPPSFEALTSLKGLYLGGGLGGNPLTSLPLCIRHMSRLRLLSANRCGLTAVPDWMGTLTKLDYVNLADNKLSELPFSLAQIEGLKTLNLDDNPLSPNLAAAYKQGLDAVKAYLRELAKGARKRFEAKLLILGDGNEGKTCVSRALRGQKFKPQVTTRGVDVEQWKFAHPDDRKDKEKQITLNVWDFEGQEINHQTHQFFLTTESLYLLVFKCRDQFLIDRAEYWLDTIRARAPKAQVAIVITECEDRTPYVPQDRLQAEYGDLLGDGKWLFAVGCADKSGIPELQDSLMRSAADLNFMGRDWPSSYAKAESAIQQQADEGVSHIDRGVLHEIFADAQIDAESFDDVAVSMATLGVITQFPDCPDLRDLIVLQPQWLTKAISEVMEDKQLADDKGRMSLPRMQEIWDAKEYEGMFATFHNCMKEFELCYDLEDPDRSCLVPLRFGYIKPEIPWTAGEGLKERRVTYKLNIRPPLGLMSRFIVKTHHMIVSTGDPSHGVYWHNGVFLRTGKGPLCSEALCEFDNDERTLSITVRAAFPQNMIEQIHAYVKAVFSFFAGLEPERTYGCIRVAEPTQDEEQCTGMHSERRIYSAILKARILDCEYEFHDVDPQKLISGLSSFGEYVVLSKDDLRDELDKSPAWAKTLFQDVAQLLHWADQNNQLLEKVQAGQETLAPELKQQIDLKLREYLGYIGQMLDDRDFASAPGIISINTVDRSAWNPKTYFKKKYVLTPFCENEHNIHPCEDGAVEFAKEREWWTKTAPWIARGTKVLSVGLQLAFAGMPVAMGASTFAAIREDVALMNELAKDLDLKAGGADGGADSVAGLTSRLDDDSLTDLRSDHKEARLMRAALSRFLEEVAPDNYRARQWGSLRRVRMSDNSYRWLCEECSNVR